MMNSFKEHNEKHGKLYDRFKQEFDYGRKVVWVAGKGNYAGVKASTLIRRTKLKVYVEMTTPIHNGMGTETKLIDAGDLVIVDKLLSE